MLSKLATETLDHIASFVDEPKDLLAVGVASRRLKEIVIPHHIEFRQIRCDAFRYSVWKALSQKPRLCGLIRKLHLFDEREEDDVSMIVILPFSLLEGGTEDNLRRFRKGKRVQKCFEALFKATSHMSNLTSFSWRMEEDSTRFPLLWRDLFWSVQRSCPLVAELQVKFSNEYYSEEASESNFTDITKALWHMGGLRRCSLTITEDDNDLAAAVPGEELSDLLFISCSTLVDLHVELSQPLHAGVDLSTILTNGHWPFLRSLSLMGSLRLYGPATPSNGRALIMRNFLDNHSSIERLRLFDDEGFYPGSLPHNTLLKLLSLECRGANVPLSEAEVAVPLDISKRLECFLDPGFTLLIPLSIPMPSLRRLTITRALSLKQLDQLIDGSPMLERLGLSNFYLPRATIDPLIETISKLKELTHLAGLTDIWKGNDEAVLVQMLSAAPSLTFVQHTGLEWIHIMRQGEVENAILLYELIPSTMHINPKSWGGFFDDVD